MRERNQEEEETKNAKKKRKKEKRKETNKAKQELNIIRLYCVSWWLYYRTSIRQVCGSSCNDDSLLFCGIEYAVTGRPSTGCCRRPFAEYTLTGACSAK